MCYQSYEFPEKIGSHHQKPTAYFSSCSHYNLKFILFQLIISVLEDFFFSFTQFMKIKFLASLCVQVQWFGEVYLWGFVE